MDENTSEAIANQMLATIFGQCIGDALGLLTEFMDKVEAKAAGDADTNACVGGALLACRLGLSAIPEHWMSELLHKDMLIDLHQRFVRLQTEMDKPVEERTANEDLSIRSLNEAADQIMAAKRDAVAEDTKKNKEVAEGALKKQMDVVIEEKTAEEEKSTTS